MDDRLALLLTAICTGALLVAAGWLLMRVARKAAEGTLRRNHLAGIRTRVTLSSDAAWQTAHLAAQRDSLRGARGLIVGGIGGAVSGVLGFVGFSFPATVTVFTVITLGATVWTLFWTLKGLAVGQRAAVEAAQLRNR